MNSYHFSRRKRALDLAAAAFGLVVLLTIALPVSAAIMITDGRPVLFRQRRMGLDGCQFTITKFRTMRAGDVFTVGRILRVTHLDEFPQWWSVLRGDMSAVGPRPHMVNEHWEICRTNPLFSVRLRVKPGVTGLAQLKASATDMDHKLAVDMAYMDSASLRLDVGLLARTAWPFSHAQATAYAHEKGHGRLKTHGD